MTTITPEADFSAPRAERRPRKPRVQRGPGRAFRWTLAVLFGIGAFAVLLNEQALRTLEVHGLSFFVSLFGSDVRQTISGGQPTVVYKMGADEWYALRITVQCSIALYIGPVLGLAGIMGLAPGVKLRRVMLAATAGVVALILLNQVRLAMITYAFGVWGKEGFSWTHGPIGSIMMLLGLGAVLLMFFMLCLSRTARGVEKKTRSLR